jgi:hypothetical protein
MTAKPNSGAGTKASRRVGRRPSEYVAAVRYHDGTRDLVRVRNADDMADARAMVLDELEGVRAVVIALRH